MDPASIIGLLASCSQLSNTIFHTVTMISGLIGKLHNSTLTLTSLMIQLSALDVAFDNINHRLEECPGNLCQAGLHEVLRQVISDCGHLVDHLHSVVAKPAASLSRGMVDETSLHPIKEALRDQVQVMQLLLIILDT
jgi:hypothetical protein